MSSTVSSYTTIYAFGDSLSDAGNAYLLTDSAEGSVLGQSPEPVSPPYYQETYIGGVTADVFSNGPVWTQDLSLALNLGTLAPSGVGVTASVLTTVLTQELGSSLEAGLVVDGIETAEGLSGPHPYITLAAGSPHGTDFAIGGAVTGPTTQNDAGGNSEQVELTDLSAQLATFDNDVGAPEPGALTTLSIGSNDVLGVVEASNFSTLYGSGTTLSNVGSTAAGMDVAQSVSIESAFIGSLVAQGLTNVLVLNVPDLGVTPEITELYPTETAAATVLSEYYDSLLNTDVASFDATDPSAHVTIENAFTLLDNAVASVTAHESFDGLTNATSPVYSGNYTVYVPADLETSTPQDQYLFFDHLHPTETGQMAIEALALSDLSMTCFAEGTRLLTTSGPVPVEALRVGTPMKLADGGTAPAIWVGHRTVDCPARPKPQSVSPVRVHEGAFGPGVPARDVFLSPDHAVFVEGVLIPVKYLIDGDRVAQVPAGRITYWHVELPRHAVLLAEGLPCESFLETERRDHVGFVRPRRGDYVSQVWEAEACAELVVTGPHLDAARARLHAVAAPDC